MCCNLPLLFLSQMVKKKFLIFFCDLAMMMMKIDESKLSNYFEFINARGFDFFWLSLFTRYSPGLYMIGRVRNRIFFWNPCFFQVWKRKFQSQFCLRSDTYEFKCFSAKKQASDWLTYQASCFLSKILHSTN